MAVTKYNKKIVEELCDHIASGLTQKDAALLVGITTSCFHAWIENHEEFEEAVQKALSQFKQTHLSIILGAAKDGTWQASAWMLERRFKDEWGRKQYIDMTTKGDLTVIQRSQEIEKYLNEDPAARTLARKLFRRVGSDKDGAK